MIAHVTNNCGSNEENNWDSNWKYGYQASEASVVCQTQIHTNEEIYSLLSFDCIILSNWIADCRLFYMVWNACIYVAAYYCLHFWWLFRAPHKILLYILLNYIFFYYFISFRFFAQLLSFSMQQTVSVWTSLHVNNSVTKCFRFKRWCFILLLWLRLL